MNKVKQNPIYIGEEITVGFKKPSLFIKSPVCPDTFDWRGEIYSVGELISEWRDFTRKGKNSRNMQNAHLERASSKGSKGVGRFYFTVQTSELRVFELYYDRSIKNVFDKNGRWILFQEFI